jgi:hypothetical protein
MDHKQCYLEMQEAMKTGDLATARERALDLQTWLNRGGFPPPNYSVAEVNTSLATVLEQTASISEPGKDESEAIA